jgi:hypothetical protein
MPRSDRSPGEYSSHRGTPKKAPPSDRSSDYDSEDDDGPTLFGSILRTLMAGGAVVAIAVLVRVASAFQTRKRGASLRVLAVDIASLRAVTKESYAGLRASSPRTARSASSLRRETFPIDRAFRGAHLPRLRLHSASNHLPADRFPFFPFRHLHFGIHGKKT